jgi:glycosyltransferase involved in cell wall biosynthesis
LDIISRFTPHSSHFTRIISEPDKGIYDAMNKGIRLATGDIIGILNADDLYATPDVLAKVAALFDDPAIEACYGDLEYVKNSEKVPMKRGEGDLYPASHGSPLTMHRSHFTVVRYWKSGVYNRNKFKWGWMPPHPTFFVRRSVYERHGTFNLQLGSAADYELMLRFLYVHGIRTAYLPEVLVLMRAGGASNESLAARIKANRMDRKAWEINGLKPYPWTLLLKPLRKLPQYFLL